MNSTASEIGPALAMQVAVSTEKLTVDLADGRTIHVPLAWYPRLAHASPIERTNWRLIGRGHGIHWPDLDEDILVDDLLEGRRSAESPESLEAWLGRRKRIS